MVVSQTTLTPAVVNTTLIENVTGLTVTPVILSSTTPGCFAFNTSTCEPCAPGSQYDNNTLLCVCCPDPGLCLFPGACLPCNKGFYQSMAGQQQCLPCDRGFYTNSPVYFLYIYHYCTVSLEVHYVTPALLDPSVITLVEKVAQVVHQSKTSVFFSDSSSGCTQCQTCPGGTEALKAAAKTCSPCRPGMHKAPHETLCQICGSGYFQIHWGQESCDVCPENHYCPVSTEPSGHYVTRDCENEPVRVGKIAGSLAPSYCMETFFRKSGDTCELAPVTIALLVIGGGVALLFIILMVLRQRRDADGELTMARAPLLRKERPQGRYYGIPCDAEPVYAGW
eukprot:superscaffoldBa00002904_g15616